MKVLLIEDDIDYANTIKELFVWDEHAIEWAKKLDDVTKLLNNKWDVIICDVHLDFLPHEVIEKCKSSDLNSNTPLLFFTANIDTYLAKQLIKVGEYPVISKFEIKKNLLDVITNFYNVSGLISSNFRIGDQRSFHRYISKYINEKRYQTEGLKQSLSGWINQLQSTLGKQTSNFNSEIVEKQREERINFRSGNILVDSSQFKIKYMSLSALRILDSDSYEDKVVTDVFPFSRPEEIYSLLHTVAKNRRQVDRLEIMLRVDNVDIPSYLSIAHTKSTDIFSGLMELEICNTSSQNDYMDYIYLKETNKILLQEIHHRVNNNLNLLQSLVNLKSITTDFENQEAYEFILNKIKVISLVFENLSQSELVSSILLKDYFSKFLNYTQNKESRSTLITNVTYGNDDLMLNVNQAIPLGLLISEMIEICEIMKLQFGMYIFEIDDFIHIEFAGPSIKLIEKGIAEYQTSFENVLIHSLLNSLGAILSTLGNDKIEIRFKKSSNKGVASNLYE